MDSASFAKPEAAWEFSQDSHLSLLGRVSFLPGHNYHSASCRARRFATSIVNREAESYRAFALGVDLAAMSLQQSTASAPRRNVAGAVVALGLGAAMLWGGATLWNEAYEGRSVGGVRLQSGGKAALAFGLITGGGAAVILGVRELVAP
jgi:hypothetical protein